MPDGCHAISAESKEEKKKKKKQKLGRGQTFGGGVCRAQAACWPSLDHPKPCLPNSKGKEEQHVMVRNSVLLATVRARMHTVCARRGRPTLIGNSS
ncbi:hypothetical protein WN51_01653 [Melipona quadrifasciata]|uniref:Uncharacterized protein n=1 Tax=Melipona quadrifasciata TaxID=166423 RepID=A0A0M8ZUF8_9HYME|nr:hypothetical protein WN51_01653 [Melipona quadrifasciata]